MIFSKEQLAVRNEVKDGKGNIAVQASPGAGKTTVLLGCLDAIPKFKKTVFLSFSKAIVEELKDRVPKHVRACTLHSLGWGFVNNHYKGLKLDENKYLKIALKMFPHSDDPKKGKDVFKNACIVKDVVDFARMTLTEHNQDSLAEMCRYYCLDFTPELIDKAIEILRNIGKSAITSYDFTDMIYLPVIKPELVTQKFDFVMQDEAQDSNECQMKFVSLLGNAGARYIFVGDTFQSIYGFMGSRVDSFKRIQQRYNCKLFTLSVSYRCPKNVVEFAQGVYDVINYHEKAKDGEVRLGTVDEIREGDMVLCRNTLPLIFVFFELLERDVKATIVGKDIANGLIDFVRQVGGYSIPQMEENMSKMLNSLKSELRALGFQKPEKHKKYGALVEKIQVISVILNKINNVSEIEPKIREIFHEDKKAAKLSTIHKAKGGENERVFIIESYDRKQLIPSQYAEQDWELVQEQNLAYVSYTRAKSEMILIEL